MQLYRVILEWDEAEVLGQRQSNMWRSCVVHVARIPCLEETVSFPDVGNEAWYRGEIPSPEMRRVVKVEHMTYGESDVTALLARIRLGKN